MAFTDTQSGAWTWAAWRLDELLSAHGLVDPPADSGVTTAPVVDLDGLAAVAVARGLSGGVFDAPLEAVLQVVEPSRPFITTGASGEPIIVRRRRGPFVQLERPHGARFWCSVSALPRELAVGNGLEEVRWLGVAPLPRHIPGGGGDGHDNHMPPLARARSILALERGDLWVVLIYSIGMGLLSLAVPAAVQALVNTVAFGNLLQPLFVLTGMLGGALALAASLRALEIRVVEMIQRRLVVRFTMDITDRLPRTQQSAWRRQYPPELINRFFEVFTLQKSLAGLLFDGLDALLIGLVGMTVLAFYHPLLLAFDVALVVACLVVFFVLGRGGVETKVEVSRAKFALAGWLEELARLPTSSKQGDAVEHARRKSEALASGWLNARESHFRILFRQIKGTLTLQVLSSVSLLALGGTLVIQRQMTLGQLVAAELIVTAVVMSLSKLAGKLETYYDLLAAADKLGYLIDLPLERWDREDGAAHDTSEADPGTERHVPGRVEVQRLTVGGERGTACQDLSLIVEPGMRIALTSHDGVAGSALADALFGLREPLKGHVLVEGWDNRDVSLRALRKRMALVREVELLEDTVAANVRWMKASVSYAQLWQVLRRVGLEEVVSRLPEGLHTKLGPKAEPLTYTEQVCLTLARALASDASIIVIDSLLDRLDPRTRDRVIEKLFVDRQRTWILVTSDPQPCSRCDETITLESH